MGQSAFDIPEEVLERTVHDTLLSRPSGRLENPGSVPHFETSTADLPRGEQFGYWRDMIAPIADVIPAETASAFAAELSMWDLSSVALVKSRTAPFRFERTSRHVRADAIDHWILQYVRKGSLAFGQDPGGPGSAGERSLRIASLRGGFAGRATKLDALTLFVPREFCRDSTSILDNAEGRPLTSGLSLLLADYLLDLERCLPRLTIAELPGVLATTRTMLLACLAPTAEHMQEARRPIDATLLERARRLIQVELFSPGLDVDMLCKALGVSRSRLYRLFEPAGGVAHYIRARRLLDAHISLADTRNHRRIADIAADRGFMDAAEFSRAFKREFGYTPSDVRRSAPYGPMRASEVRRRAMAGPDLIGLLRGLRPVPEW